MGVDAARWFQHVVRPMLRPPGEAGASIVDGSAGHAGGRQALSGRAHAGGCFGGVEGDGCPLSASEWGVWMRVRHEPMSWELP